jgi:hypothetical protein
MNSHEHTRRFGEPPEPMTRDDYVRGYVQEKSRADMAEIGIEWFKKFFDKVNDMYPDETAEIIQALEARWSKISLK